MRATVEINGNKYHSKHDISSDIGHRTVCERASQALLISALMAEGHIKNVSDFTNEYVYRGYHSKNLDADVHVFTLRMVNER